MSNPDGINQLERFSGTPAYGDVQRLEQLKQAVPISTPGGNAPQNAQRAAVRGRQQRPAPAAPRPQQAPEPMNLRPEVMTAETWRALIDSDEEIAQSPIAQWYLAEATKRAR